MKIRRCSDGVLSIDLAERPEPRSALDRLAGLPGRVMLESADESGRYSILSADPLAVLRAGPGGAEIRDSSGEVADRFGDPFAALESLLAAFTAAPPPEGLPFAGGVIGFLAYEAGDALERLPDPPPDDIGMPLAWFGVYDRAIVWDRREERCVATASVLPGRTEHETRERLSALASALNGESAGDRPRPSSAAAPFGGALEVPDRDATVATSLTRYEFMDGVERIREHIRTGDIFQANLTRRITVSTACSGTELYRRLMRESPAPFGAYMDVGAGEVASISPELFLSVRSGRVWTRPIKGTAARDAVPERDRALAEGLLASEKDRAENVMIVDLLRNDLSRVCRPGSVRVPRLAVLETHPTVHHLVSTVEGRLDEGADIARLLRATFPGGSVTGAPKIRAMEVLRELEPVRRGVYTGALGILGFHGDVELSVGIRTAVLRGGYATYGTGGGITLASDPAEEWAESEAKASAFLRAVGASG